MNVLVVGGGGREHALTWKLAQSPKVTALYIAPGNPGTAALGTNVPAKTNEEILAWLAEHPVDLVVIGPDQFLADGLSDAVRALKIPVFGPSKAAAEIEWSKAYAKQLMSEEGIPTARARTFSTADGARDYVRTQTLPIVIKADGLAAGKGVIIAATHEEADAAISSMMDEKIFGDSGGVVVIEEFLEGLEVSVHAVCDGTTAVMFPIAKDHKRIGEGDTGPNTGGMGTIAPVSLVPEAQIALIKTQIIEPLLAALVKRGRLYSGLLFPGVMLTKYGPQVIEFNARFGDPEVESYMRLLESDLFDLLYGCATGALSEPVWNTKAACCVMVAAKGYPGAVEKGAPITLPPETDGVVVFHAGTALKDGQLIANGGRVLAVTAPGDSLQEALSTAYRYIERIECRGKQYRKDIGASVLEAS